jgi:hypothetical protein
MVQKAGEAGSNAYPARVLEAWWSEQCFSERRHKDKKGTGNAETEGLKVQSIIPHG